MLAHSSSMVTLTQVFFAKLHTRSVPQKLPRKLAIFIKLFAIIVAVVHVQLAPKQQSQYSSRPSWQ